MRQGDPGRTLPPGSIPPWARDAEPTIRPIARGKTTLEPGARSTLSPGQRKSLGPGRYAVILEPGHMRNLPARTTTMEPPRGRRRSSR